LSIPRKCTIPDQTSESEDGLETDQESPHQSKRAKISPHQSKRVKISSSSTKTQRWTQGDDNRVNIGDKSSEEVLELNEGDRVKDKVSLFT
jgi:hypothetical protein